jgi:hypothetical protein
LSSQSPCQAANVAEGNSDRSTGLVQPDEWLAPYERYLPDTPAEYQEVWGAWVAARLGLLAVDLADLVVEIHAAPAYIARISPRLDEAGATVQVPLADVPWNEHLAWYDEQARTSRARATG